MSNENYDSSPEIAIDALAARAEEAEDHARLRVLCVAMRFIVEGELVHNETREFVLSVPRPGRHHNIMYLVHRAGFATSNRLEQGFLLSDGTFATRERALEVAKAANQIIRRCGGDEHALFSENLW